MIAKQKLTVIIALAVAVPIGLLSLTAYESAPEPGNLALFGIGLIGLGMIRRQARDRANS